MNKTKEKTYFPILFDWKVQKLDFQIHINIPQPKVLYILDAGNIIIGLKINNIVANIISTHSFVLIKLRGFFKSDYVQPETHLTPMSLRERWDSWERDRQTDGGRGGSDMPKNWKEVSQYTLKFLTFFSIQPTTKEG